MITAAHTLIAHEFKANMVNPVHTRSNGHSWVRIHNMEVSMHYCIDKKSFECSLQCDALIFLNLPWKNDAT